MATETQNTSIAIVKEEMPSAVQTAIYLQQRAEVDNQIATAKAFPRSIKEFMDKAESMATINEDIAASCNYTLPRGGKKIEGPSVRFAEIIVAAYGNIRCGARVIDNDGKTITAQGVCHDLESNVVATVEIKKSLLQNEIISGQKTGRKIPMNEDMQVMIGNAACAIAYRNAVYKVIPAAFVEGIYEKTKEVAKGKAETMIKRRDKALEYARGLGIKDSEICSVLEIKKVEDIDLDKLAMLRGILAAIKNGESTLDEVFRKEKVVSEADSEKSQTETESDRFLKVIQSCDTLDKLNKNRKFLSKYPEHQQAFMDKETELTPLAE